MIVKGNFTSLQELHCLRVFFVEESSSMNKQSILKLLLRLGGAFEMLAFIAVVMPRSWMEVSHNLAWSGRDAAWSNHYVHDPTGVVYLRTFNTYTSTSVRTTFTSCLICIPLHMLPHRQLNKSVHMRRRVQTLVASLFVANLLYVDAMAQQPRTYPPFTLVSRYTEYDSKGETVRVSIYTRYESSNGDWRVVSKVGADELATVYRRGKGVYQSNSRTTHLIKESDHAPGCLLRTGEELRRDPKFTRTEEILGFTAYVLTERPSADLLREHYFVPKLGGGTPFKQVTTYTNGPKVVNEPISVTLGEPAASEITGPDYLVIEQVPTFFRNIAEQLLTKPDPDYPTEALARGLSGVVNVTVTVDENGRVIIASGMSGAPQSLREAAVEAAYKASFKPIVVEGRAVVATGIINYQFVLPE